MVENTKFEQAVRVLDSIRMEPGIDIAEELPDYHVQFASRELHVLQLEEEMSKLSIIHVAGTKGKGSTCTFAERILRASGFKTGLFTSPHLLDIRERIRINGQIISKSSFGDNFWWCWERLKNVAGRNHGASIARFFRLLTILAFKIFISEKVDVVILEVGLGGRNDPTNVVKNPVVCGITSLGYDHTELLGETLAEIASHKAGILKVGAPAITVPQPVEAMQVLKNRAKELNITLEVAAPLEAHGLGSLDIGLKGEHQRVNAALAVALCKVLVERTRQGASNGLSYVTGLVEASLEGRAQTVQDMHSPGRLSFYLDGAHSPESMLACGKWFSHACEADLDMRLSKFKILLFNCMPKRSPRLLLPPLRDVCARESSPFQLALFVPSGTRTSNFTRDLSWQKNLQEQWESLQVDKDNQKNKRTCPSLVLPSVPAAIQWLRLLSNDHPSLHLQVLVTGSLYLVGDVLRFLRSSELQEFNAFSSSAWNFSEGLEHIPPGKDTVGSKVRVHVTEGENEWNADVANTWAEHVHNWFDDMDVRFVGRT